MLDRTMLYDLIYALAAIDGREEKLFGDCAPLAHEAFMRGNPRRGSREDYVEYMTAIWGRIGA